MSGNKSKFDTGHLDAKTLRNDKVFRAISDISRRHMLMLIRGTPGITMTELCDHFSVSRFAIIKHLNILEETGLIRRVQEGSFKRLFLNVTPLEDAVLPWTQDMLNTGKNDPQSKRRFTVKVDKKVS